MKAGQFGAVQFVQNTQRILQSAGIDPIFGYDNLVWAPNWGTHKTGTAPAPNHGTGYTGLGYAQAVYERIHNVTPTKNAINDELRKIATSFIQGVW
jgi:hypothetical protein